MADDEHAVFGHGEVELERGDADRERRREGFEGIFRDQSPRAAMALQVECHGGRR